MDDPALLAEQYADADNLRARIRLHEEYSTAPEPWWPWVFDRVRAAGDAARDGDGTAVRVLEVGCGPGDLWVENADRVPAGWTVVPTDRSPGMVEQFRTAAAGTAFTPSGTAVAAAEALPVADDAVDVVVANHVLYHVDRERALPEMRRVLRSGGRLVATTNGEENMREVRALLDEAGAEWTPSSAAFSLESGPGLLRDHFDAVAVREYEAGLRVPDLEPLVAYAASLPGMGEREVERFAELARDALADGSLAVHKEQGALVAAVE